MAITKVLLQTEKGVSKRIQEKLKSDPYKGFTADREGGSNKIQEKLKVGYYKGFIADREGG